MKFQPILTSRVVCALLVSLCGSYLAGSAHAGLMTITASDNADSYPNNPDHNWPVTNGGFGYGLWTPLSDTSGGGHYMEGVGVNGRQVDGNYSFALFAGSGGYDISRPLSSSLTAGEFQILTRFDLAGNNIDLVNLRAGNDTSGFGSGELLSFGLVNGNALTYTDSSGMHTLPSGEARGAVWQWTVDFDDSAGTYSAEVSNVGGGYSGSFSGNLELSGTSVGSFAVINTSSGSNQNLIFDNPVFSVPEPSSLALFGVVAMGCLAYAREKRRRRQKASPVGSFPKSPAARCFEDQHVTGSG
jgi:hypothetical protein